MRSCHRATLLLAVALLIVSGICTATAANVSFPPEYTCNKIISRGKCNSKACDSSCFSQHKGNGRCNSLGCQCTYICKPPPGHPRKAGGPASGGRPGQH
ncbi:hypothetical protein QOZ80_2AG0109240 [Eleusine coracana subsp. coracana]|nr:hypothetical protein QOZ80_2AG0109240 [Eleusine coracana subsp. coracana]